MKNHDTPRKTTQTVPYLRIPLEVAQDDSLSDGAILLFGEIYGIQSAYGYCFASDTHFMARRSKGRSTIQRQITELCQRGHLHTLKLDKKCREMRVAERYLGEKDRLDEKERAELPKNENEDCQCPKNEAERPVSHLINEKVKVADCPKNETHKTPEFKIKNQENITTPKKRMTLSLSSGVVSSIHFFPNRKSE